MLTVTRIDLEILRMTVFKVKFGALEKINLGPEKVIEICFWKRV